jgi:glycosyltransferase involved in cell wall biosynthesis
MRRKILHVVGAMNRGGVECWLMNLLRNLDRSEFETHFLVHTKSMSAFDREIITLGGQIHYGANPRNPFGYAKHFRQLVRRMGGFDVVHSHVYLFSGLVMRLARQFGVSIRVAHSHTSRNATVGWNLPRKHYEKLMRQWILRYSTHRIGISEEAGKALFGDGSPDAFRVMHYGLDFAPFYEPLHSADAKQRLGIALDRKVIGHVGRFAPVKNHAFTIEIFERMLADGVNAHLLLVGDGPLFPPIRAQIASRGLSDRCTLAGSQSNVVPYISAMDVFVLPSYWEGLGIVALESQAVGVPVVASTGVPSDVDVIPELVEHVPLSAGVEGWTSSLERRLNQPINRRGDEAVVLGRSKFGLKLCLEAVRGIYIGDGTENHVSNRPKSPRRSLHQWLVAPMRSTSPLRQSTSQLQKQ